MPPLARAEARRLGRDAGGAVGDEVRDQLLVQRQPVEDRVELLRGTGPSGRAAAARRGSRRGSPGSPVFDAVISGPRFTNSRAGRATAVAPSSASARASGRPGSSSLTSGFGVEREALQPRHRRLGLVQERREDVEGGRERVVVGRGGGNVCSGARDQVAQRGLVLASAPTNTVPPLRDQPHDGAVLDVEHLEDVGGVGGERGQVAEHAVEVLVVAL